MVTKTDGKLAKKEKSFEKVGIPEEVETSQIENLIENL